MLVMVFKSYRKISSRIYTNCDIISGFEAISLVFQIQWMKPFKQGMIKTKSDVGLSSDRLCQVSLKAKYMSVKLSPEN